MEQRKYTAANMREALEMVRRDLGDDAIILETRTIGPEQAGSGVEVLAQLPAAASDATGTAAVSSQVSDYLRDLQEEMRSVHNQLEGLTANMAWLGSPVQMPGGELTQYLVEGIAQKLPTSGGIHLTEERQVVAFVGPTGVGKTTTICKLLWNFSVTEGRKVGAITTDTFRIGGTDMLRVVCDHLDVPCEVAYQAEQLPAALERLAACELILLDSPGGSQRNAAHLAEIQTFLTAADPNEVHLVLNAGASAAMIREVLYRCVVLQPDHVILTKLDEAPALLDVLPLLFGTGLAVSYLSTGPSISADLLTASSATFSQLLA